MPFKPKRFHSQIIEGSWCVLDRKEHGEKIVMTKDHRAVEYVCEKRATAITIAKELNERAK